MNKHTMLLLILSLLICTSALAQTDLTGTWQGKMATSPNEKLTIQFTLTKQANGSYTAVLNSPDSGAIKNVPATRVKFAAGVLTIEVASLSGSYSGTVGKGVITGEWKQQDTALPLVLTPYQKPAIGTLKPMIGEWVGEVTPPGAGKMTTVFRFELTKDSKFAAYIDIPEQNASGIPVSDVVLEGNLVTFKIPTVQAEYEGRLSGLKIEGAIKQGGQELKLNLTKGKYEVPGIAMPAADMKRLLGQWVGKYAPGGLNYTFIWKFEQRKDGKLAAVASAPETGPQIYPITDISLKGDELSLKIPGTQGEFIGKLGNNSLSGTYGGGGTKYAVSAIRGAKYEPATVDIPAETMKKLLGRWNGKIGSVDVVFRFEQNAAGKGSIFVDIPAQGVKNMMVTKSSIKEGVISMNVVGADYTGKLNGSKIDGTLKPPNQPEIPLLLTKEESKQSGVRSTGKP